MDVRHGELETGARLLEALEGVGVLGEWSFDYATGMFRSSAAVSRAFDIAPDDGLHGLPVEVYERAIHPADVSWLRATRAAAPGWSGLRVTEIRVTDGAGRLRWIMVRGRFVLGDRGRPILGYGIMLDVTDYNDSGERPFVTPAAPFVDPLFVLLEALSIAYRASRQVAQAAIERGCRDLLFRTAELLGRARDRTLDEDTPARRRKRLN
ncbi:hypothetical protein [Lichenibacterium ramalinae]|uniref:PAS domain-containing protein n=1 Tax=Lichenibacterium ramalinae TaxID=2316527 RepID=A0A4Q2R4Z9_9HYPH|nr:hypothetical protein [Lichenibacterium ramalinae]RYB01626.1 hypothetical protein D3272_25220 [Lichenibacterium ramalinae]